MLPLESVATATDSPRYSPAGTFRKLGTDVIGISGTPVIVALSCALAAPAQSTRARAQADVRNRFIAYLPRFGEWFVFGREKGWNADADPTAEEGGVQLARGALRMRRLRISAWISSGFAGGVVLTRGVPRERSRRLPARRPR